jgi:hypothetical protein
MSRTLLTALLLSLSLSVALAASPARAEGEPPPSDDGPASSDDAPGDTSEQPAEGDVDLDEDLDLDGGAEEEPLEEGMDNEAIYTDYKAELRGEDPIEEADAWKSYLQAYPRSLFRLEIEERIDALDEASFDELLEEQGPAGGQDAGAHKTGKAARGDAKSAEMDLREPVLLNMSANTRRKLDVGVLWGFQDYFNYEIGFEWAFRRQFSAFGGIRHTGKGIGTSVQAGAKYALIKDTRTGVVLSAAFSINVGYSRLDQVSVVVEPWLGFGWIASELIQVQTSIAFDLRVNRLHTAVLWDVMLVLTPSERIGIYIESRQKHSLLRPEGQPVRYLGFHQAGVGVKIRPSAAIEISLGANIPYGWRHWKDYRYVGAHANLTFYFNNSSPR